MVDAPAAAPPLYTEIPADAVIHGCGFDADGWMVEGTGGAWTWKNYPLADTRARRAVEADEALPEAARLTLLSPDESLHIDFDGGWMHGALTDTRHKHYSDGGEIGRLRFAFDDTRLVTSRRHPLQSVDDVWQLVLHRKRAFRRPADLIEAIISRAFERLSAELRAVSGELDTVEDKIVGDDWHRETERLTAARRRIVFIHRHVANTLSLFRHMEHLPHDDLPPALADMILRLSNRSVALFNESDQLQSRARLLQDEIMARLTAESNRLLYVLSMLTAVLLPMTIVSGLFGMNVGGIPLGQSHAGFWVISALAVATAVGVFVTVRRIGKR
jgi:zinc transporter